jgi:hypothetical protein
MNYELEIENYKSKPVINYLIYQIPRKLIGLLVIALWHPSSVCYTTLTNVKKRKWYNQLNTLL